MAITGNETRGTLEPELLSGKKNCKTRSKQKFEDENKIVSVGQ